MSVWYEKSQYLGTKLVNFGHFYIVNQQKNTYEPVMIANDSSADTQKAKYAILKTLVHDFSEGVWTAVDC